MRHTSEKLGLKEKKALRLIARREERGDPSPGLLEIGCVAGSEGVRGAQELLSRLARDGYLIRDEGWERMLRLTGLGWRLFAEENPSRPDGGATRSVGELYPTESKPGEGVLMVVRPWEGRPRRSARRVTQTPRATRQPEKYRWTPETVPPSGRGGRSPVRIHRVD